MNDVQPRLKENVGDCGCGCGRAGTLRVRPWKDGTVCVSRGCECPRCIGKRNKQLGQRKQAKAVSKLGVPRSSLRPGHEELLGGTVRIEVKAGVQVRPAVTAFERMERQSEAQRPVGDHRPFVGVAMPEGSSDGVVLIRLSVLPEAVAALAEQLGGAA